METEEIIETAEEAIRKSEEITAQMKELAKGLVCHTERIRWAFDMLKRKDNDTK